MVKRINKYLLRLIIIVICGVSGSTFVDAQSSSRDKRMIKYAKNLQVSKLDSSLPKQRVETWLQSLVGAKTVVAWEINDCGAQSGVRGSDSHINPPLCAEVQAKLPNERQVIVTFVIGTHKAGIKGSPDFLGAVYYNQDKTVTLDKLRELPALLRK
jgi:hypothetical protein